MDRLVRCWNCNTVIDLDRCKPCIHTQTGSTAVCPYCDKCLCQNPKFEELKKKSIKDNSGWHVGKLLVIKPSIIQIQSNHKEESKTEVTKE